MKKWFFAIAFSLACSLFLASVAHAQILPPQGRLTLQNGTPVMTINVVGASTLYYTPYVGNSLPISNGTSLSNGTFSQLSLDVGSTAIAQQTEDVYAIVVSSAFQLCLANGWSSNTRSSGFGLTQLQGIWVNASTLTNDCATPTNNYTVPAQTGIYLGTIYTSEYLGSTNLGVSMIFNPGPAAGGNRNMLGVYNAYNRVRTIAQSSDNSAPYTYSSASWRETGGNSFDNISFVDGLQQSFVDAQTQIQGYVSTTSSGAVVGVNLDSSGNAAGTLAITNNLSQVPLHAFNIYTPQLGLHTVYSVEYVSGTGDFDPNSGLTQVILVELEM